MTADKEYKYCLLVNSEKTSVINEWCFSSLSSIWSMSAYDNDFGAHPPVWTFESKEDYIAFVLRWAA